MPLSPAERTLRARYAAHVLHANGGTSTEAARAAFDQRFLKEVDPDGTLEPAERAKRAASLRKAYFARLSLQAAKARRRKAEAATPKEEGATRETAEAAEAVGDEAEHLTSDNPHPRGTK